MSAPTVSILVNNHNYGRFLTEAIDSALAQSHLPIEVVVVDDGSTDDSAAVIARYGDRVAPVLKGNGGQGSSFNAGFAACQGDVVLFLDADDAFAPDKAARVAEVFEARPEAGWCFHPTARFDTVRQVTLDVEPRYRGGPVDFSAALRRGAAPHFAPATSGLCFGRSLLEQILPMPELEGTSADRFLKLMAIALAPGHFLDEPLATQKVHGGNAYTLRPDRERIGAKSLVHCAAWLRGRVPELAPFTDKMFARGLGIYRRTGGVDARYAAAVDAYLGGATPLRRLAIALRARYHASGWLAGVQARRVSRQKSRAAAAEAAGTTTSTAAAAGPAAGTTGGAT